MRARDRWAANLGAGNSRYGFREKLGLAQEGINRRGSGAAPAPNELNAERGERMMCQMRGPSLGFMLGPAICISSI